MSDEVDEVIDGLIEDPSPKKRRKLTPEQEDKERKFPYGCRYQVSVAKLEDKCCYVGVHNCDTLKEAQQVCVDKSVVENRECVVWDYECSEFVFRQNSLTEVKDDSSKPTIPIQPVRKHKPRVVVRK